MVISYFIIISLALLLSIITRTKLEKNIPTVIFTISLILYVFALLMKLNIGIYFILIIFILSVIIDFWFFIKLKNKKDFFNFISFGFIIFSILYFIAIIIFSGRFLSSFDEFSHWGLAVKNMYEFDMLYTINESSVYFKSYPPIVSIFQLFIVYMDNTFIESHLIMASITIINAIFCSFLSSIYIDKFKKGLFYIILMIAVPTIFNAYVYEYIYVDGLIGIILFYIVFQSYKSLDTWYTKVQLMIGLAFLSLTKSSGLILCCLALLFVIFKELSLKNKGYKRYILLYIISSFLPYLSWSLHLKMRGIVNNISMLENFKAFFSGNRNDYFWTTLNKFFSNITQKSGLTTNIFLLPFIIFLLVFIMFIIYITNKDKQNERKIWKFGHLILICNVLYLFSILFLYLFGMDSYEAIQQTSLYRFLSTILIFDCLVIVSLAFEHDTIKGFLLIGCFLLINANYTVLANVTVSSRYANVVSANKRNSVINNKTALSNVKKGDRVYFIAENTNGYEYWTMRFLYAPIHFQEGNFSLGTPYDDKDIWTKNISVSDFKNTLKDYDYLYIYKYETKFVDEYADLFDSLNVHNDALYKITVKNGELSLSYQ